jgi:hypothetical protein
MGNDDAKGSRADPETRKASLLLSGLVLTPDSALRVFRERRAANPALDLDHLRQARDILDALHAAIASNDAAMWEKVERAWGILHGRSDDDAAPLPAAPAAPAAERRTAARPAVEQPEAPPPPARADEPPASRPDAPPPIAAAAFTKGSPWARGAGSLARPWAEPSTRAPAPAAPAAPPDVPAVRTPSPGPEADFQLTLPPDAVLRDDEALPFHGGPHAPPPRAAIPAAESEPTQTTEAVSPFARAEALPFGPRHASDPDHAPTELKMTRASAPDAAVPPPSTPGAGPASAPTAPAPRGSDRDRGPDRVLAADRDVAPTERLRADMLASLPPESRTAPFVPPSAATRSRQQSAPPLPPHLESIGVERYAALGADLALYPDWSSQIHARYGLAGDAERALLDEHWARRFAADPELEAAWRWHRQNYLDWARQQRR